VKGIVEQQKNESEETKKGFDEILNDKIKTLRFLESDNIKLQVY